MLHSISTTWTSYMIIYALGITWLPLCMSYTVTVTAYQCLGRSGWAIGRRWWPCHEKISSEQNSKKNDVLMSLL